MDTADRLLACIADADQDLEPLELDRDLVGFASDYRAVLRAANAQIGDIADRLSRLNDDLAAGRNVAPEELVYRYIDAMSVDYEGDRVFLPSFSDSCLEAIVAAKRDTPRTMSPFRGLYYAWVLGEIAYDLERSNLPGYRPIHGVLRRKAFRRMEKLLKSYLNEDFAVPATSSYKTDVAELESAGRNPSAASARLRDQVVLVKRLLVGVISKRKWAWIPFFPYACRTSTHFYLSGIRYFWNPSVSHAPDPTASSEADPALSDGRDSESFFAVHSTDSGLALPCERYGMLLPSDPEPDLVKAALKKIPVGSLALELDKPEATGKDIQSLLYFERWSKLVTDAAQEAVSRALAVQSMRGSSSISPSRLAIGGFLQDVRKNPMRTFYFDCGLLAAAKRNAPGVRYLTTEKTHLGRRDPGRAMLQHALDFCGDGLQLRIVRSPDWPDPRLSRWTLVPMGSLGRATSCVWSERGGEARKIIHGWEGRVWQGMVRVEGKEFLPDRRELAWLGLELTPAAVLGGVGDLVSGALVLGHTVDRTVVSGRRSEEEIFELIRSVHGPAATLIRDASDHRLDPPA